MVATHAARDGIWERDLLATAGPFVPLAALLLGLAYLVLDPTLPRHVVLVTGSSRSEVAECGARKSSIAPSVPYRPASTCAAKPADGNQWRAVPKPRQRGLEVQILAEQGMG